MSDSNYSKMYSDFEKNSLNENFTLSKEISEISPNLVEFVKIKMESFECSAHDLAHCYRVAEVAAKIATKLSQELNEGECPNVDIRATYISGFIHDVFDSKFSISEDINKTENKVKELLNLEKIEENQINKIILIAKSVGFKNLIKHDWNVSSLPIEYRCVQDADLLDAIGAIGVARCFSFGGRRKQPMFSIRKEIISNDHLISHQEYINNSMSNTQGSSIEHFFEKLFRIKSLMCTKHGKELAEQRHSFMLDFLYQLGIELGGENGKSLFEYSKKEDENRIAYNSIHNGVILCLLDEALGSKKDNVAPDNSIKNKCQDSNDEQLIQAENTRFNSLFRTGMLGLIVESLDLDNWW